jgi:hypothetical protein
MLHISQYFGGFLTNQRGIFMRYNHDVDEQTGQQKFLGERGLLCNTPHLGALQMA